MRPKACIVLSNLALACTFNLALKVLQQLTLPANTVFPLWVEHSENNFRVACLTVKCSGGRTLELSTNCFRPSAATQC